MSTAPPESWDAGWGGGATSIPPAPGCWLTGQCPAPPALSAALCPPPEIPLRHLRHAAARQAEGRLRGPGSVRVHPLRRSGRGGRRPEKIPIQPLAQRGALRHGHQGEAQRLGARQPPAPRPPPEVVSQGHQPPALQLRSAPPSALGWRPRARRDPRRRPSVCGGGVCPAPLATAPRASDGGRAGWSPLPAPVRPRSCPSLSCPWLQDPVPCPGEGGTTPTHPLGSILQWFF